MDSESIVKRLRPTAGTSLLEVLIASVFIGGLIIGVAAVFQLIGRSQADTARRRTAAQFAQDQIETLKARPFGTVLPTLAEDGRGCLAGGFDRQFFPPEELERNGVLFRRQTCVEMVRPEDSGAFELAPTGPSTGLKRVVVSVHWPAASPRAHVQLESILEDPVGPERLPELSGMAEGTVRCAGPEIEPIPCANIVLYAFNSDQKLVGSARSGADGSYRLDHVPLGTTVIRPQLLEDELAEPAELRVSVRQTSTTATIPALMIRRTAGAVVFKTNRPATLVIATQEQPKEFPPDVDFRTGGSAPVFSKIFSTNTVWRLPSGSYWFRCWSAGPAGIDRVDPPGGWNRILSVGDRVPLSCEFKNP